MRRRKRVKNRFDTQLRSGYTLIEMLIAAVLVAALMSVVYGMMSMYNSYLTAGQSQAVEQQLIRSVLQLLEQDLQNVAIADTNPQITPAVDVTGEFSTAAIAPSEPMADPFSINPSESAEGPSIFSGSVGAGIIKPVGRISLSGSSSSFRLSIERLPVAASSRASRLNNLPGQLSGEPGTDAVPQTATVNEAPLTDVTAAIEGTAPKVPEFQSIIWQFQSPGVIQPGSQALRSGLYRIQADSLALQTTLLQQNSRLEDRAPDDAASVDQMTMEALLFPPVDSRSQTTTAEASGSQMAVAAPQFDLVPEVVSCRFEYFSGSGWTSSWNSELQNGLPAAVRVRLRLVTPSNLERLNQSMGTASSQSTPIEQAFGNAAGGTSPEIPSNPLSPGEASADPFRMLPTRQVERIILLQPITGPMPQPDAVEESNPRLEQVSAGWEQRLITDAEHHSAQSLLPRFRGRSWPTGRMRGLTRVAVRGKAPLPLSTSLTWFAATRLCRAECSYAKKLMENDHNTVVRYRGRAAS